MRLMGLAVLLWTASSSADEVRLKVGQTTRIPATGVRSYATAGDPDVLRVRPTERQEALEATALKAGLTMISLFYAKGPERSVLVRVEEK